MPFTAPFTAAIVAALTAVIESPPACPLQLLAVVLCLTLLDDSDLEKCLPIRWHSARVFPRMPHWGAPIAVLWISLTLLRLVSYADLPAPAQSFVKATYPLRSANAYGLFAVMTTTRPEVILEGSREGKNWVAYRLPAKPGPLERMPPQVAPHMPRLDWQLWFAALGNCEQNRWVLMLKKGILDGSPAVLSLFAEDPFEGERPVVVRSVLYDYRFTSPGESGWWRRERLGEYCPRVSQPD